MRIRPVGGVDLATGALILSGACLVAAAFAAVAVLVAPAPVPEERTPIRAASERPAAALSGDQVAAVLTVDIGLGAGAVTRVGDHIDVLGYFPHQVTGADAVTRVLLENVQVLAAERSGSNVALTLAVPQQSALLLQGAQALGARPFVTLRGLQEQARLPATFSDSDLATHLAGIH